MYILRNNSKCAHRFYKRFMQKENTKIKMNQNIQIKQIL